MADGDEDDKGGVIWLPCFIVIILGGVVFMWDSFANNVEFEDDQLPGYCVDGRSLKQSFNEAIFQIDDTEEDDDYTDVATMSCSFDTLVYPCPPKFVETPCAADEILPDPLPPRQRTVSTSVKCKREGEYFPLNYPVCRHNDFTCEAGPCDAYEKTTRLCVSNKLKKDPYACYYVPGTPGLGVREARSGFPIWWLLGSIAATLCAIPCVVGLIWMMVKACQDDGPGEICKYGCMTVVGIIVVVVVCVGVGLISQYFHPTASAKGKQDVGVNQTSTSDQFGVHYAHETSPPTPGLAWYWVLAIVFGVITVSIGCPLACIWATGGTRARSISQQEPLLA